MTTHSEPIRPATARSICCGILIWCALSLSGNASAWVYSEHQQITTEAHQHVCDEYEQKYLTTKQQKLLEELCSNPFVAICHGHMSAVAADNTATVNNLIDLDKNKSYLVSNNTNCSKYPFTENDPLTEAEFAKLPLHRDVLGNSSITGTAHALILASRNESHFFPDSRENWKLWLNKIAKIPRDENYLHKVLSNHAFALHYLEDSFAAGHHGIDRGNRIHDLDRAHHQKYNADGLFLESSSAKWFAYGDDKYRATRYAAYLKNNNSSTIESLTKYLSEFLSIEFKDIADKKSKLVNYTAIQNELENANPNIRYILNFEHEAGLTSTQLIVLNTTQLNIDACNSHDQSGFVFYECAVNNKHSTQNNYVLNTAIKSTELMFDWILEILTNESDFNSAIEEIYNEFPVDSFLLTQIGKPGIGVGNTSVPDLLGYTAFKFCYSGQKCPHENNYFRDFGLGSIAFETYQINDSTALHNVNVMVGVPFQTKIKGIDSYFLPRAEAGITLMDWSGDTDWYKKTLSGAFAGASTHSIPDPIYRIVGLYFGARAGVRHIWSSEKYYYGDTFIGLDIKLGSTIIFSELHREVKKVDDTRYYENRISLGMRFFTIP